MIPTWKQKLLCTGCAAVLAAGLVPMAAWGGATEEVSRRTPDVRRRDADERRGRQRRRRQNAGKTETEGGTQTSGHQHPHRRRPKRQRQRTG
ncbi:MAG: hypothetical protein ACLSDQ_10080 [Adlercreutzia equolifaciens]